MSSPILNPANQTALKYYQPAQVLAQKTPSGSDYVFVPRAGISMAWVNEADVPNLLGRKAGCNCGGKRRQAFFYANEADVRRWTNGGGR